MSGGMGEMLGLGILGGKAMGGGSSSQTTTQITDIPAWMKPYAQDYMQRAQDLSNKPYQAYGGQTVAGMDPRTQQGLNMQAQYGQQGTAAGNAGQQEYQNVLGGQYLGANSNPYLSGQIDAAQQDVVRNYNTAIKPATESAMVNSGSFGNSGLLQMQQQQQSDLQRNLGNISTQMRGNAYNTERANQMQALGMSPTFNSMAFGNAQALQQAGQMQQAQNQAELSDAYSRWQQEQQYPYQQLNVLGSALGHNFGGSSSSTQPGPSGASQLLGGGLALAGLLGGGSGLSGLSALAPMFVTSDRRAKTDINRVGHTDDGLPIYTYRYKAGGPTQMGVMADEAQKMHPHAVGRMADGMLAVDYSKLKG